MQGCTIRTLIRPGWQGCYNATMDHIEVVGADAVTWQEYRALRLEALLTEPQAFGATYADSLVQPDTFWQSRLADATAARSNWMVFARRRTQLVGMIGAYQDEAMATVQIGQVVAMYVTTSARGRGISRQLMASLLAIMERTPSIRRLRLDVNVAQTAAVHLYERMGFVIVEHEHVQLGDGKFHDGYVMEKILC